MKPYVLIILSLWCILTGCTYKSFSPVIFDTFTMKLYDNNKIYTTLPPESSNIGIKILTEMKEETKKEDTGFINSFIVTKIPIQSWTDMKTLVDSNTKNLQLKLLKYKNTNATSKKIKCNKLQYSWYITEFSYQLDNQILYEGQYFFTDEISLYVLSLSSDNQKDINSITKSIGTVKCIK